MKLNKKHESGIVSIMVTMVMLIVISLIVLGFAEISRTEQRNTTDAQLSVSAYYGAESGINDALAVISAYYPPGQQIPVKPDCNVDNNLADPYHWLNGTVNNNDKVSYTCLTVNPTPITLTYSAKTSSTVIPLTSTTPFSSLNLDWGIASNSSGPNPNFCNTPPGTFPPANTWGNCYFPVLRVDLLNANGQLARGGANDWSNDTSTMFLVPSTTIAQSQQASMSSHIGVYGVSCSSTDCRENINLNIAPNVNSSGGDSYYMRVTTLYRTNSKLTISANNNVNFTGSQVIIDSTGKAQDILRRIEVAVDLTGSNAYEVPSGALITEDSVCKKFGVATGIFGVNSDPNMNNAAGSDGDYLCQPH